MEQIAKIENCSGCGHFGIMHEQKRITVIEEDGEVGIFTYYFCGPECHKTMEFREERT